MPVRFRAPAAAARAPRRRHRLKLLLLLLVPAVLAANGIPTPESVFGFKPGADYKLATYDQSVDYFRRLDAVSKNVRLVQAGATTQGRPMYFALVSSAENLARIDHYREIARRLAHPQGLTEAEARRLAREGKAFVHIDGGLHSTEVAGWSHTPQLLYDLVNRAADPDLKPILDNVVLMLWPTINPDGQQMVAEWYMKNVGTPYELSGLPRLYQEYVGHDNNRDAYMLNMVESRVLEHTWRQWEPQIIYVHHQSGPFPTRIWLPPFSEPVGVDAPFVISREVNMIGMAIAKGLEERGQVGATHMGTAFDAWYPGYVDYAPNFKNIAAFWTETALYQYATPHEYTVAEFPPSMRDLRPQSLYASPWPPGWWRLRDAVQYMETASLSVLEFAAKYKESLLYNRYQAGRDQIALGRRKPPFAYVIPQQQRDPVAAVELLRRMAFGGIRVSVLTDAASIDGESFPAGTWVIPTDQEFAALAREVLDLQRYPDLRQYPGGPPERPYDAAGWSLPLQMGVHVVAATTDLGDEVRGKLKPIGAMPEPKIKPTPYEAALKNDAAAFDSVPGAGFNTDPAAGAIAPPEGRITGSGAVLMLDPAQNNTFKALNRAWEQGATVQASAGSAGAPVRYSVRGLAETAQEELVRSLALQAERTLSAPGRAVRRPRLGLFQPWSGAMDEGWTRWVLEQYGFRLVAVRPEDFASPLDDKIDVLIIADDARVPVAGASGAGRQGGRGGQDDRRQIRPEYAYQLTPADLQRFEQFVRGGGTVVCLSNASTFAIQQLKLPVRNVVAGLRSDEFFLRGSIVEVTTDPSHPVMAGMPAKAAVFVDGSPVFEPEDQFTGTVLARYQESGSPLLSGYLIGENYLHGKAAALDVPLGDGHVVLIGFRPEWRGQPFGTFRVLFNAALFAR
ncbi:MAG TPA: M14 metallopeptidase family protein [Vicinamibacterales bacterium]|nr:M14 metallopeptidase family protein [Vicinamibacterales bacterium]